MKTYEIGSVAVGQAPSVHSATPPGFVLLSAQLGRPEQYPTIYVLGHGGGNTGIVVRKALWPEMWTGFAQFGTTPPKPFNRIYLSPRLALGSGTARQVNYVDLRPGIPWPVPYASPLSMITLNYSNGQVWTFHSEGRANHGPFVFVPRQWVYDASGAFYR